MCFKFFRASSSGLLRLHGPQSRRCSGSHHTVNQQPSQSSPPSTVQQPATCSSSARVDRSPPLSPGSSSPVVVSGPSSVFLLTSPSRVPTIRHLPKASRRLTAPDYLREAVSSHLEEGDFREAIRLASASDALAPPTEATLQALQEKHPPPCFFIFPLSP